MNFPRILIAGIRGGSGKTLISLGLIGAWRNQSLDVAAFKKGPDYIDAAWLSMAAGRPCRNLDLFLMPEHAITRSFLTSAADAELAVIEGNRGLYDGMDAQGSYSSAELAKLLRTPVILAVDCTKATRTIAAIVLGCQQLDPLVPIRGVVLNRTAGPRHESTVRGAIEQACDLPVLGAVPRINKPLFPERHLGLVPPEEHSRLTDAIQQAATLAADHLDLDAIRNIARQAPPLGLDAEPAAAPSEHRSETVRIGVFRDAAFAFYYPENLEAIARAGARLIDISPMGDAGLPEVDGLYIGGGFPEMMAPTLAANSGFRESLRRAIENGLPVYAECGGAVYLGEKLVVGQDQYPMVATLPVVFALHAKPQGHGYVELETVRANPFFPVGDALRGHEFHYTCVQSSIGDDLDFAFRVRRGRGFDGSRDGLCHRNVLASYTHVHALGTESWAPAIVAAATRFRIERGLLEESRSTEQAARREEHGSVSNEAPALRTPPG